MKNAHKISLKRSPTLTVLLSGGWMIAMLGIGLSGLAWEMKILLMLIASAYTLWTFSKTTTELIIYSDELQVTSLRGKSQVISACEPLLLTSYFLYHAHCLVFFDQMPRASWQHLRIWKI